MAFLVTRSFSQRLKDSTIWNSLRMRWMIKTSQMLYSSQISKEKQFNTHKHQTLKEFENIERKTRYTILHDDQKLKTK